MILEGSMSNEDILYHVEKIEALEENNQTPLCHENSKIEDRSSYQIHEGLT